MERRRRQDDGGWNRPNYGSAQSHQARNFYHQAAPQYQQAACHPPGPYPGFSHGRAPGPPVPWDSGARLQDPAQGQVGVPDRRLSEHGAMGPATFQREAQADSFPQDSAGIDGSQLGMPPTDNTGQRAQYGGPQTGIPPPMTSTQYGGHSAQYGGPQTGIPPPMTSTGHRAQYGGHQPGIPPPTGNTGQGAKHGGHQPGIAPPMTSTGHTAQYGGHQPGLAPSMTSTEQQTSHHGAPHAGMAGTEQRMPQHGAPYTGMASTEQRMPQHGPPHTSMASTEQRIPQHGAPHTGMASTEQRMTQHGALHTGIPHMASAGQRVPQHGGIPPPMTSTGHTVTQQAGPPFGVPPPITGHTVTQHGGLLSDFPPPTGHTPHGNSNLHPHMAIRDSDQRTFQHMGAPSDIPPHIVGTDQRTLMHGGSPSDIPPRMTSTDQRTFQHGGPPLEMSSCAASTEQMTLHHRDPQSGISPHVVSTEQQQVFQQGGPQSGNFNQGLLQPRSFDFGAPQHEGQLLNKFPHKDSGQDTVRMDDSQNQAQSFLNPPQSAGPRVSSVGGSLPEAFKPTSLHRPPNEMFHYRVPPPSIIQRNSEGLPPGPAQNIQHNTVQSHCSFPPPLHRAPLNPPNIPSFVPPLQMDAAFSGPPRESGREVSHIQHLQNVLDQEPFMSQRSGNTAVFRQDNPLHQELRQGHKSDLIPTSEGTGAQNHPLFMKNSFQASDSNFFHQNVPDILRDHQFRHQQMFNEQHENSLMNPNRQSEMVGKDDPSDKEVFQRWLQNFLAGRKNNFSLKSNSVQSVSIPEVRNLIYGALTLVSQLRSLCQTLENNKEDGPSWAEDYEKAKDIKGDLVKRIKELEKPGLIQGVKTKLERIRKKRQRRQAREEDKEAADHLAEREAEIDSWRIRCIQEVEEKKKERELKAAADSVLGEVRKKQADTKKMLDMLKSLEKLRKLRKEAAARKGVSPPPSADETFKNHISRLRSMVHKRVTLYDAEERALRVILEGEQEEERQREKDKRLRKQRERFLQKQRELDSILFGEDEPLPALHPLHPFRQYYLQAEHSVVSLVQIRHEWDQFLAPSDHPDASSIPRGWVLPMPPSSEIWATALKPAE